MAKTRAKKKAKKRVPAWVRNEWTGTGWVCDGFARHRRSTTPPIVLNVRCGIYKVPVRVRIVPLSPSPKARPK